MSSQPAPNMSLPALTREELSLPSTAQTERLLNLAKKLWKAKPWKHLEEGDIFVVRHPNADASGDDETLSFVGAIGGAGEQAGLIIYRGTESYFGLLDFLERASQMPALPQMGENSPDAEEIMAMLAEALSQANFNPMELMQLPQLQLMFEPRENLEDLDEEWIKRHNYKATGSAFPTFRAVVSGFLPWWISADEAEVMAVAIEQMLELIERKGFSSELIEIREVGDDENWALELFARVPTTGDDGKVSWDDERLTLSPNDAPLRLKFSTDAEQVEQILALPASREVLEIEIVSIPTPLGDAETRPYFPSLLLLGHNKQVVGMETLPCGPGLTRMPLIVEALVRLLSERKKRPKALHFSSSELDIVRVIEDKLGITVEEVEELPTLDPAIASLLEHMADANGFDDDFDDDDFDDSDDFDPKQMPKLLH